MKSQLDYKEIVYSIEQERRVRTPNNGYDSNRSFNWAVICNRYALPGCNFFKVKGKARFFDGLRFSSHTSNVYSERRLRWIPH